MHHDQNKRNAESNLLWATTIILSMAASCAAYTSYVTQSVLDSLKSADAMVVLIGPGGIASDDKNLERNLNVAQAALETSSDISLALTVACAMVASGLVARVVKHMKYLPVAISAILLSGCWTKPAPIPVQPAAPTGESAVSALGRDLDKTDHRVGAALVAIERNADKPKVVVAESRLAQSYLPQPPEQDVSYAMARATKQDPIDYAKQMEFGRKLATAVNKAWERVEADQAEAKRVSDLKDKKIAELTEKLEQGKKDLWTMAGVAIAVLGALATAFAGPKIGLPLMACGSAIGAFPFIVDSPYFTYIVAGSLGCLALLGLWLAWDWVRDRVKSNP